MNAINAVVRPCVVARYQTSKSQVHHTHSPELPSIDRVQYSKRRWEQRRSIGDEFRLRVDRLSDVIRAERSGLFIRVIEFCIAATFGESESVSQIPADAVIGKLISRRGGSLYHTTLHRRDQPISGEMVRRIGRSVGIPSIERWNNGKRERMMEQTHARTA